MKRIIALLTAMLLLLSACSSATLDNAGKEIEDALTNISDADNKYVLMVKGGYRVDDPSVTYEDAFSAFFGTPRWKYFKSEDGQDVVEFTGDCVYRDASVKARIQFVVDEENGTFQATYLAFNEVPQDALTLAAVISKAFEEVTASGAESSENVDVIANDPDEPVQTGSAQDEPAQNEPSQDNHPAIPVPSDYIGTWVDTTYTYQMDISYKSDGTYIIYVFQDLSDSEWRQWSFEGYGEEGGIFYSGGYADLYLRDDGTVGGGGAYNETDGIISLTYDGILYWNDSALGLSEIRFTKQ